MAGPFHYYSLSNIYLEKKKFLKELLTFFFNSFTVVTVDVSFVLDTGHISHDWQLSVVSLRSFTSMNINVVMIFIKCTTYSHYRFTLCSASCGKRLLDFYKM